VAAMASCTVALDNVSSVKPWFSDALCRAVTGDGSVDRALYTDDDVCVLTFRRAVAMTSIDAGSLAGDLAERLLPVELHRILESARRSDTEITAAFDATKPEALGALLDLLVQVIAVLPTVTLESSPRMKDFALILAALDQVTGTKSLQAYERTAADMAEAVVESDPFAEAVRRLGASGWSGTASELLLALTPERPPKDWPTSARGASGALRKAGPALRSVGIGVSFSKSTGRDRRRMIDIAPVSADL
jgi:hypothetical protein